MMDIKEEILAQMDSALRPEFDKAIDNTIEGAFKEDVKTLGFMVANSIKCQWEVMKPHLFYAYCLGVKAQEAKAQSVPEGFVLVPVTPSDEFIDKLADVICSEFCTTISGSAHCATEAYKLMIEAQELANEL
ncbi:hypothetical protein [Acinetobacter lwoffii]|uniref:hypothetical protein n=1 Tax=Acinetobacter lwoffii TaxID=28090 RepID=UPI00300ACCCA